MCVDICCRVNIMSLYIAMCSLMVLRDLFMSLYVIRCYCAITIVISTCHLYDIVNTLCVIACHHAIVILPYVPKGRHIRSHAIILRLWYHMWLFANMCYYTVLYHCYVTMR